VPDDALDFVVRKAGHMTVFGILALLIWRALATTTQVPLSAIAAIAVAILYAITDELHQGAVNGRHASPIDVGIDAVGAIVAVVVIGFLRPRRSPR
jgi:VanZ family protein